MGRHQLYVVACVNGYYKCVVRIQCIVTIDREFYYVREALEAAVQFLKACQHPFNVHSIRAELNALDFRDNPKGETNLCPFIATLLCGSVASRANVKRCLECIQTETYMVENNADGITVFDITNPSEPQYCFVSIRGLEHAEDDQCKKFVPLNGETYVRAYFPIGSGRMGGDRREDVETGIESIKPYETVPHATLKACWPEKFWREYVPDRHHNELEAQEEAADCLPSLAHYAMMKLRGVDEWSYVPEHVIKACAKVSGCRRFPSAFMQRLLSATDKGNMGILDLSDIAITFAELIQVGEVTPLLSQSTRYLNLSTWINPAGGQVDVSDLVALQSRFPGLLCVNAIGNDHFNSGLLSEWYGSDFPSFSVLCYATRTEGDENSSFRRNDFFGVCAQHTLPFQVLIADRMRGALQQFGFVCIGQPFFLPPPALMHCIYNLIPVLDRLASIADCVRSIQSVMSTVDDSAIPVLMPAVSVVDPRVSSACWTLVLDRNGNRGYGIISLRPCYAFVYRADKDSEGEVMGLDGFLSSPNVGMIEENQQGIVSDLRSAFDGMILLSERYAKDVLALPSEYKESGVWHWHGWAPTTSF